MKKTVSYYYELDSEISKKDRHAYAFAYGNYREWIEAARTSIMNCMKRDCNNMSKHFGIELDAIRRTLS